MSDFERVGQAARALAYEDALHLARSVGAIQDTVGHTWKRTLVPNHLWITPNWPKALTLPEIVDRFGAVTWYAGD